MHADVEQELLRRCEEGVAAALAAGADQAEVYAHRGRETSVGFANNDLNSVTTNEETTLGIRVFVDGRLGFATTNHPASLADVAGEAVAIAKSSPPDPHNGLPEPRDVPAVPALIDDALLALGPKELADLGQRLLAQVRDRRSDRLPDARVTVDKLDLGVSVDARAIVSSTGVRASHRSAHAQGGVFGMALNGDEVGSFSYDGDAVRHAAELEPALAGRFSVFVDKCFGALAPGKGESFRGPALLPADVVESFLVAYILSNASASSVRKGVSAFADKLGERIAVPGFTLVEAGPGLDGHPITPFDREGQPRQRTVIVEDGVLKHFLYDSYEARHAGVQSTGHAAGGAGSQPSVGASCFSLAPGDRPLAELAQMDKGVVVTRFSGSTDPSSGDFSGVIKGGFLVQGGERRPIKETTIAGNLWTALQELGGISRETETFYGSRALPSILLQDISVTAG